MAVETFDIKVHDLLPVLRMVCTDAGEPVDLTNVSEVRLLLKNRTAGLKVDALMEKADQEDEPGVVTYEWQDGDTDTVGTFLGEIQVLWPGQKPMTFPAKGNFQVRINRDLGPTTGPGSGESS